VHEHGSELIVFNRYKCIKLILHFGSVSVSLIECASPFIV